MPYLIDKKTKCIYKKNPDGSRGKRVGCTKGSLMKYLKALQTNVKENMKLTSKSNTTESVKQLIKRIVKEEMSASKQYTQFKIPPTVHNFTDILDKYKINWSYLPNEVEHNMSIAYRKNPNVDGIYIDSNYVGLDRLIKQFSLKKI